MDENKKTSIEETEEIVDDISQEYIRELQADPQELIDKCKRAGIRLNPLVFPSFYEEDCSGIVSKE